MRFHIKLVLASLGWAWIWVGQAFLWGQPAYRYTGPLKVGSYSGEASYQYEVSEGDSVLNGPFSWKGIQPEALLSQGDSYFSFTGYFASQVPDSSWEIQLGEFEPVGQAAFIDYHVKVPVSGILHTARVQYRNGKPQGTWTHSVKAIEQSVVGEKGFESQVNLDQGIPQGSIRLEDEEAIMLGRFLPNGLAHDVWELDFEETPVKVEQWAFVEGRLERMLLRTETGTDTLAVYAQKLEAEKPVSLGQRYVEILALQGVYDSLAYAERGGHMLHLIVQHATYSQKITQVMDQVAALGKPVATPTFRAKVAHYPLTEAEKSALEAIKANLEQAEQSSRALRQNTRLKLLKHSDEEVSFLLAVVEALNQTYLSPAKQLLRYEQKDLLPYFPRQRMRAVLGLQAPFPTQVPVSVPGTDRSTRTFTGPAPALAAEDSSAYGYLSRLAAYAVQCLDSIEQRLGQELKSQQLQAANEELERSLISQAEGLEAYLDSLSQSMPPAYQPVLSELKAGAKTSLRQYATEQDLMAKPERARASIACLEALQALARTLAQQPARRARIQELYTEEVWNPFTATTMQDQVKERLTRAYDEFMIPAILERLTAGTACAEAEKYQTLLDALYKRMEQLRREDTSKLERKLKNEDNPQVLMELFGMSL